MEFPDQPARRMRLGTRSCAECRRRKVRCSFPPGSHTCEGCQLHQVACKAQEPGPERKRKVRSSGARDATRQQRLDELEDMVQRLRQESASDGFASKEIGGTPSNFTASDDPESSDSDDADVYGEAPLIRLFDDALMIRREYQVAEKPTRYAGKGFRREDRALNQFRLLIPSPEILVAILEESKKYWPIFPPCYTGEAGEASCLKHATLSVTRDFLLGVARLESGEDRGLIAKAALWLALCIQQLPLVNGFTTAGQMTLPQTATQFVKTLMSAASSLLSESRKKQPTLHLVESLGLEWKLHINMGRPRQAWLAARQAVDACVLLGLHRPNNKHDVRSQTLWAFTWFAERQVCTILGLPSSVPQLCVEQLPAVPQTEPSRKLLHRLGIISGRIIERDQMRDLTDYATTISLDQELEAVRGVMPPDFWIEAEPSTRYPEEPSLEALYAQETIKMQYYLTVKHLHLPFMLHSPTRNKFHHSRAATVQAAKGIMRSYQRLRESPVTAAILCEIMDFSAFNAAVVVVIDLLWLANERGSASREDWALLASTRDCLRKTSETLKCPVAEQSCVVLDHLLRLVMSGCGGCVDSESILYLPYFGKLRISPPTTQTQAVSNRRPGTQLPGDNLLSVMFSVDGFSTESWAPVDLDTELGSDWSLIGQPDEDYDWTQTLLFDPNAPFNVNFA